MSKNTPPKFTEHPLTHVFAWLHSPMEENYKASRAVIIALWFRKLRPQNVRELLPQTQSLYQVWVLSAEQCLQQTSPGRGQVWGKGYKIENTWRRKEKWRIRSPIKICQKGIRKERKCGSSQEKAEGRRKAEGAAHERGGHPVHLASCPATSTAERPRATGRNLWTIKNCLFLYATNDKTVIKCNGCFPRVIAVNIFNRSSKCFGV